MADDVEFSRPPSRPGNRWAYILLGALAIGGAAMVLAWLTLPELFLRHALPISGAAFGFGVLVMTIATALRGRLLGRVAHAGKGERLQRAEPGFGDDADAATMAADVAPLPPAPVPVRMPAGFGEIGITAAAEKLIDGGVTRALFISPEGDEAAASSVLVARELADAGLKVLLLDLTPAGAAGIPMLENTRLPGITELLAGQAQFTEIIHPDLYSGAHVIPSGAADPVLAAKAIERLPIIMDALVTAYDVVVVECGPTDAASVQRLMADGAAIMISVLEPHDPAIAASAAALEAAGFRGFSLISPEGHEAPEVSGRNAA